MDPQEFYFGITPVPDTSVTIQQETPPIGTPATTVPVRTTVPTTTARVVTTSIPPTPAGIPAKTGDAPPGLLAVALAILVIAGTGGAIFLLRKKSSTGSDEDTPDITSPPPAREEPIPKSLLTSVPEAVDVSTTVTGAYTSAAEQKNYFPRELEIKYTEIEYVGRGGIAWVFSARRKTDGQKVAVKIPISFDEMTGRSFLNEIKAWETLRHPNIVEVSAVNILPVPYVEMEFVPGSLEAITDR
jgi:hypothetical protein